MIFIVAVAPFNQYAALDYRVHHGRLPQGWLAVALGQVWPLFLFLIAVLLWLFPEGRLPSGRWRRTAVLVLLAGALLALAASGSGVAAAASHDIRVNATGSLLTEQGGIWNVLHSALALSVVASWLVWLAVQVPRYRHATGERVQHAVDRRFNRACYNAEAIVATFTARMRQTVDLDTVRGDLVGVVDEAFQPAHVSVWLAGAWPPAAVPAVARPGAGGSGPA